MRNCSECKKLLETKKVGPNTRRCQKVAEQLVESPKLSRASSYTSNILLERLAEKDWCTWFSILNSWIFTSVSLSSTLPLITSAKGRTIRKLIGGGGAGEVQKTYSRKGKLNKKNFHARQLILKKYSCYGLKKIHSRNLQPRPQGFSLKKWVGLGTRLKEFDQDKKFLQLEISPLPHNFSNRPSLRFELLSTLWRSTFKICAVCVNGSPIRYGFVFGARAVQHSVNANSVAGATRQFWLPMKVPLQQTGPGRLFDIKWFPLLFK